MAQLAREAGTLPELEVFDSGDIHLARDLIADGTLESPALFQIVLGAKYGANATHATMAYLHSLLPAGSRWASFGIGRAEYPMLLQAWILGGHVRVGLEDNIYLRKGVLAPDNAALVAKAVHLLNELGAEIATPDQAREILGLNRHGPRR
jgi:uncharacterized protein (DUF849 family)